MGLVSKPVSNALSPWEVQTFSSLSFIPVIALLASLGPGNSHPDSRRGLGLAFASGLASGLGNVAYYKALAVAGKAALYPVVTIGLALLSLRERLHALQVFGAVLSLAALYCFNGGAGSAWLTPWLAVAVIPIVLWGITALLQKLATNHVSAARAAAAFLAGQMPVSLATQLFVPLSWGFSAGLCGLLLVLGLCLALGNLTLICAYERGGKAAIVTPLASLYSLITIPLAVLLLRENFSAREGLGIGLALVDAVALSWEKPIKPNPLINK